MLFIYITIIVYQAFGVEAYSNNLFYLIERNWNITGVCDGVIENAKPLMQPRQRLYYTSKLPSTKITIIEESTFSTVPIPPDIEFDPFIGYQSTLNKVLFGENTETDDQLSKGAEVTADLLGLYPSGQIMRAELFQNKSMVHLPRSEWMHAGHSYLNTRSPDFMQTAVNAFSIFVEGSLADVERLPPMYILRSSRTIAMMNIAREKLVATWKVVKGDHSPVSISYRTLEYFRPLFKYIHGREMSRLNLSNERILSFIGTHSDLSRHQVGIVASQYIKENKNWDTPKSLNMMNNLLCGVPMKFMRRVHESVYLQLSHQLFYHIKACDPLQRRFYLAMMSRTQVLGKSNSWGARDLARLGLLLTEVEGPDLSAINPEAMSGITAQVMKEMPARKLKFLTGTQIRHLSQKPLNILTKKLHAYDDEKRMLNSFAEAPLYPNFIFYIVMVIKLA